MSITQISVNMILEEHISLYSSNSVTIFENSGFHFPPDFFIRYSQ